MAEPDNTPTTPEPTRDRRRGPRLRPRSPHLTVFCSEELIDSAVRRDSRHCWVSEAVQAVVPEMKSVTSDLQSIRFFDPKKRLLFIYFTPPVVGQAICEFDEGIRPQPFGFELKNAVRIIRAGRPKGSKNGTRKSRAELSEYQRQRRSIASQVFAKAEEPFEPPKEQRERVIRALEDPTANLGPIMAFDPPDGNHGSIPMMVGGSPPPRSADRGNLARTRRFGLRQLRGGRWAEQS